MTAPLTPEREAFLKAAFARMTPAQRTHLARIAQTAPRDPAERAAYFEAALAGMSPARKAGYARKFSG